MHAGDFGRIDCKQRFDLRVCDFARAVGQGPDQIIPAQRMLFAAIKSQARVWWSVTAKGLDCGAKIQTRAEAEFAYAEERARIRIRIIMQGLPAFRQAVLVEKDRPGFRQAARSGKIDVVEIFGNGNAVFEANPRAFNCRLRLFRRLRLPAIRIAVLRCRFHLVR